MFCPNCGNKVVLEQKFCRSCGLALEKIAQSLVEQLPARLDETLEARKNRFERLGVAALSVFGLGVLGFFLYMVGYKLMLSQGNLIAVLGLLGLVIVLGCGILSVILFAKAKDVDETVNKRRLEGPATQTDTTDKLLNEGFLEPVPTVTERTTELLYAEKRKDPNVR